MTKLLQVALEKLGELPENRQNEIASAVLSVVDAEDDRYQLDDEQVAEVERRLAVKNPKYATMKELKRRVARRRA